MGCPFFLLHLCNGSTNLNGVIMKRLMAVVVALCALLLTTNEASAQESGDFKFGFRTGYYFRANGFTTGIYGTYGITSWLNVEPGVNLVFKRGCMVDVYCDFQLPLEVTNYWAVYPIVGVSVNNVTSDKGWAGGLNIGLGTRYELNSRWGVNMQVKLMPRLPRDYQSVVIATLGLDYNF